VVIWLERLVVDDVVELLKEVERGDLKEKREENVRKMSIN
jgi:hypothetical protein